MAAKAARRSVLHGISIQAHALRHSLRPVGGAVGALVATLALYVFFSATSGRISVNGGAGFDGAVYEQMAKAFDLARWGQLPPVEDVLNRRFLPEALAHYIDANAIAAFTKLNVVMILAGALAFYGILRFYEIPWGWSLLALALWLVTFPGLRLWVFYPVLTDATGNALLLIGMWATLTRRLTVYAVAAAALMVTRENGVVLLFFFALFQTNPWNTDRATDRKVKVSALVLCNLPALAAVALVHYVPPFPALGHYDQLGSILVDGANLLSSPDRQVRTLEAYLNVLGLIPYALWWGLVVFGVHGVLTIWRQHLHWFVYAVGHLVLAPLAQPDDPQRTMILAVPILALATVQCLRCVPLKRLAGPAAVTFLLAHAALVSAFSPLRTTNEYLSLFVGWRPATSVAKHLKVHAVLGLIEALCFITVGARSAGQRLSECPLPPPDANHGGEG